MGLAAWFTLALVLFLVSLLTFTRVSPDIILSAGLTLLLVFGILTPEQAFSGFANPGVITVGVLYIVVAGLQETGGVHWLSRRLLGKPKSLADAQLRLMTPVTFISAFLNNTPVVAMLIPAVNDWAQRHRLAASKLMIPLSYAAILGGTCTLIGTSTNLVVNGLLISRAGLPGLGMFSLAWVGLPTVLIGFGFILLAGRWLLPDNASRTRWLDNPKEYSVEMLVEGGGPLVGQTIEDAGLRQLPGMYLAEIDRKGQILPAVSPQETLHAEDRLLFVGIVESVADLQKIRGITPATNQIFKLDGQRSERMLIEAVVSSSCPLVGQSIREGNFRSFYNAVVIAVARNGERVKLKVGDIVLRPGDTLLLEARGSFVEQQRNSRDFFLVSGVANSTPPRYERALIAVAILAAMILTVIAGLLPILEAAMVAAGLMIITRCCTGAVARRSVDWRVLITIAAAFGVGEALEVTGAAQSLANTLVGLAGSEPLAVLAVLYAVTALFSSLITNNAAAVLVFPIALSLANDLGVNFMPFAIGIIMAASASFATPISYQTNLMVYGPGGYRFSDYLKIGLPLNLLTAIIALLIIPRIWSF